MNSADDHVYENAGKPVYDDNTSKFLQKRMVYVNDISGGSGNYPSNSVEISTQVLTNSSLWCDFSDDQCVIEIPVVLAMHPVGIPLQTTDTNESINAERDWEASDVFQLEQFHNLISGGISLQYNNTQVEQRIPHLHRLVTWKLISEANALEKEKNASKWSSINSLLI